MAESKKDLIVNVRGPHKVLFAEDINKVVESIDASAQKVVAAMATAGDAIVGLKTTIKNQATEIKSGLDSIASDAAQMAKSVDASVKKASASGAKAQKAPVLPSQEPSGETRTTRYSPRVSTGKSIPVMPPGDAVRYQEWLRSRQASSRRVPFPEMRHEIQDFGLGGRPPRVQKLGRHSTSASERAIEQIISNVEERDRTIQFKSGFANFGGPDIETLRRPLGRDRLKELRKFQAGDTDVFEALRQETQSPAVVPKKTKAQIADEKFEKEVARARRAWREALNQQNSRYFDQMYQEPVAPPTPVGFGGPDIETLRKPLSSRGEYDPGMMNASGEVGDRRVAHAAFEALRSRRESEADAVRYEEWLRSREVSSHRTVHEPSPEYGPARPTAAEFRRMDAERIAFVRPVGEYGPHPTPEAREAVDRRHGIGQAAQQLATGQGLYGTSRDLMPTELHEAYDEAEKILAARKLQLDAIKSSATASNREKVIADEELQVVEARLKMNKAQSAGLKEKWSKRIMAEGKLADALLKEQQSPSVKNSFAVQTARKEFQQANRDYEAARNPHASDKGVGGQNLTFAAGQLAYGVEDFFQVLAAGQSPMRAFLGAANNIGPALGLIGVSGMHASIGIAAALGVTALFAGSSKRAKDAANDWRKSLDQLHDSAERFAKLRRQVSEFGSVSSTGISGSRGFLEATKRLRETPVNAGFEASRFRAEELSAEKRTINARRMDEPMALSAARSTGEAIAYAFAQRIPVELSRFGRGLGLDFTEKRRFSAELFQSPKDFGEMSKEMGQKRRGEGLFGNVLSAAMGYGAYRRVGSQMVPLASRMATGLAGWAGNAYPLTRAVGAGVNPMAAAMSRAAAPTFGVLAPLVRTMPVFARLLPVLGRVLNAARLGSMATPAGFAANAAITVGGMMLGKSIGDSLEKKFRGGISAEDETRINKTVATEKERFKELKESGAYKRIEDAIRELDMAIQHRAELVKNAAKIPQFMSQAWDAASEIESKFGARGLRDEVVRGSASDIVQGEQAIRQADSDVRERLADAEAEKSRAEKELQDLKTGGARFRNVRDEYLADNPGSTTEAANLHATASLFNDMQAANAKAILARKNVEMIKGAPEAERRIQEKRIEGFNQQLGNAGFGLRHFNDVLPGIVSEIIQDEERLIAIRSIIQKLPKMTADRGTVEAALSFEAVERKFNSSVQSSVRSARGGRQENALFGPDQKTGRELNSEEAVKTLEEERDLAIERARARHANNPQLMNQEIENRRVEFERKIQAERVRGSGHEFSMITLDKQLADLQRAIEGATRGIGDPRIVGRMQEQAAGVRQGIIESDPLTRLKNDLDGFSMVVATAASETEKLVNANKAQNGRLSDLSLAIMDTTSFLKKMGFEVERLPDTLKKMDDRAKAAMRSIDERNLPAEVKARMKEDVRLQTEATKARAEFSDIANAGSREARGGFAERGVFSTPQGRKTGKMLNFEAAVKTQREELEVGNKEIRANGGPNAEKAIADRQAAFQRRVAEMMDQAFGITQKKQTRMIQGENLWSTIQESINQDPSIEIEKSQLAVLESIYNALSGNEKAKPLTAGEQKMANGILAGNVPDAVVAGNAAGGARKPGGFRLTEEQIRNREKERERQKRRQVAATAEEEANVDAAMRVPEEERTPEQKAAIDAWESKQEEQRLREKSIRGIQEEEVGPRGSPAIDALKKGGAFGEGAMAMPAGDNIGISLRDGLDQSKLLGDILTTLNTRLENIFGAQMQTVGAINNAEGGLI